MRQWTKPELTEVSLEPQDGVILNECKGNSKVSSITNCGKNATCNRWKIT